MAEKDIDCKNLSDLTAIAAPSEPIDLDARGEAYLQDAILQSRRAYFHSNCPRAYLDFDPSHKEIQQNRAQIDRVLAWRYETCDGRGILASGPTRRGKTRAMYALCKRLLCEEGRDVGMWHAKDWFTELQSCVRYGHDEAGSFVKRTAERRILFFDDYGQEAILRNREDWATGWFFRLLDLRIGNRLPVLMTTNLTSQQMADNTSDVTSDPLVRRLIDCAKPEKFQ